MAELSTLELIFIIFGPWIAAGCIILLAIFYNNKEG